MTVREFILEQQNSHQKKLLQVIDNFLISRFELEPKIRYRIPFYYQLSWVCYLNPISGNTIEWAFIHGHLMSNDHGMLQSKGRKQVRGIEISSQEQIFDPIIETIVHEALIIDEMNH